MTCPIKTTGGWALAVFLLLLHSAGCSPGTTPDPAQTTGDAAISSAERPQNLLDMASGDPAEIPIDAVAGGTVYVPVYSHIFHLDEGREFALTATLSVRNTDPGQSITVAAIGYHDSAGRLIQRYVEDGFVLPPLASRAYVVEEQDRAGGVGASFLVVWAADARVSPPIVEAVMISTRSTQGISFVSRGRVVRTVGDPVSGDATR